MIKPDGPLWCHIPLGNRRNHEDACVCRVVSSVHFGNLHNRKIISAQFVDQSNFNTVKKWVVIITQLCVIIGAC